MVCNSFTMYFLCFFLYVFYTGESIQSLSIATLVGSAAFYTFTTQPLCIVKARWIKIQDLEYETFHFICGDCKCYTGHIKSSKIKKAKKKDESDTDFILKCDGETVLQSVYWNPKTRKEIYVLNALWHHLKRVKPDSRIDKDVYKILIEKSIIVVKKGLYSVILPLELYDTVLPLSLQASYEKPSTWYTSINCVINTASVSPTQNYPEIKNHTKDESCRTLFAKAGFQSTFAVFAIEVFPYFIFDNNKIKDFFSDILAGRIQSCDSTSLEILQNKDVLKHIEQYLTNTPVETQRKTTVRLKYLQNSKQYFEFQAKRDNRKINFPLDFPSHLIAVYPTLLPVLLLLNNFFFQRDHVFNCIQVQNLFEYSKGQHHEYIWRDETFDISIGIPQN